MNPKNFFIELKRCHVYRMAVAYAVVAWLLIQAAPIFLPALDVAPWVMKVLIRSPDMIEVKVDRPFVYAIQHVPSGACLFLGWITDPL